MFAADRKPLDRVALTMIGALETLGDEDAVWVCAADLSLPRGVVDPTPLPLMLMSVVAVGAEPNTEGVAVELVYWLEELMITSSLGMYCLGNAATRICPENKL